MKTATLYIADFVDEKRDRTYEREETVAPKNGENFELEELQKMVGGTIDMITFPSGKVMICNDEGRINGMPKNTTASEIWEKEWPIEEYPNNNPGDVFGSVLICGADMVK